MDEDIRGQLSEQSAKLDAIYHSVEQTRKYFLWTLVITVVVLVLPLVGLFFMLPGFLSTYSTGSMGF
jgi:hypothetical protein